MDARCFVLCTGCQWHALQEMAIGSRSAAPRRCQAWTEAGVFLALWKSGLVVYDAVNGRDGAWLALDGAMTTAPVGGKPVGQHPTERGPIGAQRHVLTEGGGVPSGRAVEGAKRHDVMRMRERIARIPVKRPAPTPAL